MASKEVADQNFSVTLALQEHSNLMEKPVFGEYGCV